MPKSILGKTWQYPQERKDDFVSFFLMQNNITNPEEFFDKKYPEGLIDEKLLPDIDVAVKRIGRAIEKGEKIVIFGDYDCDGIPGTAICVSVLLELGAKVSYRIPDREKDGYGLKNYFLDEIKQAGASLVITVDNGISSIKEAEYAKAIGLDMIITDHHKLQDGNIPDAVAVINPQREDSLYPFDSISGACVAWKLMMAVAKEIRGEEFRNQVRDNYIELVALSTVADIMPLVSENRVIVSQGLKVIRDTKNEGLIELFDIMDLKNKEGDLSSEFFGFGLGPRINAAGRMSSPYFALQLLLGKKQHAIHLERLNEERKKIVQGVMLDLEESEIDKSSIVILHNKKWRSGIIGLIAGKITEKLNLPSIVLQDKGEEMFASCRAPEGFDMFGLLSEFKSYFIHFGGHEQACGFGIKKEKFDEFKEKITKRGKQILEEKALENTLKLDSELFADEVNIRFAKELEKLGPFGHGNKKPIFLVKNIKADWQLVGSDKSHIAGTILGNRAVGFGLGRFESKLSSAGKVDLALSVKLKKWRGEDQLSLQIEDIMISKD